MVKGKSEAPDDHVVRVTEGEVVHHRLVRVEGQSDHPILSHGEVQGLKPTLHNPIQRLQLVRVQHPVVHGSEINIVAEGLAKAFQFMHCLSW